MKHQPVRCGCWAGRNTDVNFWRKRTFPGVEFDAGKDTVIKGISTSAFGNLLDVSDELIKNQRARTSPIEIIAR